MGPQALSVIETVHINHLACSRQDLDRHIVIPAVLENNQPSMHTLQDQIGGQIEAGFSINGFYEDDWDEKATPLNNFSPMYIATLAIKLEAVIVALESVTN